MRKNDLARMVSVELGIPINKVEQVLEQLFEMMELCLSCDEPVVIRGFGRFEVREKSESVIFNPQTGEPMSIPARRGVRFVPSSSLKRRLNEGD